MKNKLPIYVAAALAALAPCSCSSAQTAPAREELIRRYNIGCKQPYAEQTHVIDYQLVSGKRLKDSHGPILDELDIQPDKIYGVAHVYEPRKEPTLGGGVLTVIYDPETGAILYAKKSR